MERQSPKKMVLGVGINDLSMEESLDLIKEWVGAKEDRSKIVATVGPEFLVTAQENPEFFKALNEFDLALPEGTGLRVFNLVNNRVPGVDLVTRLCKVALENNWKIGFLGAESGVGLAAAEKLKNRFKELNVIWAIDGSEADRLLEQPKLLTNYPKVDLLLVAFGHPKQELFLRYVREKGLRGFKVGIGVGGSLDYLSETKSRFPRVLAPIGLEWLGRLIDKPSHIKRIWRATVVFAWLFIRSRLSGMGV